MKGGLMNELTPEAAREAGLGLWDAGAQVVAGVLTQAKPAG